MEKWGSGMNMRRAQHWEKLAIMLSVAVITLVLMAQTTFASGAARVSGAAPSGSLPFQATDSDDRPRGDKPIPLGELVRRGIFGTVLDTGDGFVIIETTFGDVTVNVENSDDFAVGDRFAALLDRSPVPAEATDPPEEGSFRTVTALRVTGVPSQSSRLHQRALVVRSSSADGRGGKLTVLDDDGNEIDLDTDGDTGAGDGEDTVLLVQGQGEGAPLRVLGTIPSFAVDERLARFRANAAPQAVARIEALFQARTERIDARLQRLEDKAPPGLRDTVRGARDKNLNRGRSTSGGDDGDGGPGGGQPDEPGKPDDPGKPDGAGSSSSDNGNNQSPG